MSELPQLDPVKLYNRAKSQISDLTDQAMQMDAMIEALVEERDKAFEERDKAQEQLREYLAKLEVASAAKKAEENPEEEPLEGTVME